MQLFDSLGVDGDGWVCVATLAQRRDHAVSPDGATVEHLAFDDPLVTNICFGGETLRHRLRHPVGHGALVSTDLAATRARDSPSTR